MSCTWKNNTHPGGSVTGLCSTFRKESDCCMVVFSCIHAVLANAFTPCSPFRLNCLTTRIPVCSTHACGLSLTNSRTCLLSCPPRLTVLLPLTHSVRGWLAHSLTVPPFLLPSRLNSACMLVADIHHNAVCNLDGASLPHGRGPGCCNELPG